MFYSDVDPVATGNSIKALCYKCGLSASDLRRELGLESVQAVYKWYSGKCIPSIDKLFAMEKLFSVSIHEIVVFYQNRQEVV